MLLNIAHLTVPTTSTTTARSKMARARLAAAQLAQQSTFEALNQIRCPKSLKNIVFPDVTELFSVLTRSGIFLSHTTDHDILQANLRPKNRNIDTEMARQLAVLACVNLAGAKEPLVRVLGSSSWNRRLPNEPILPPPQNQFQLTEDKFAESLKRSRGWLSEPELREHERLEKKREKAEKKRLEQEAKKPGSTVPPPKKIEQKIEKGMPEPLGPGTYGFTKLTVDIRAEAVEALKNYMKEYLQSIFPTQAVVYDKAACFVVGCNVNNVDMSLPPLRVGSSKGGELDPTTFSVRPASTAGMTGDERAAALEAANATRDTALESLVAAGVTLADFSKSIYGLIKEPAPKPLPPEYVKACADIEAYESKHKKGKKGKKGRRVVEESGEELDQTRAESRVTQTKPYDVVTCDFHSMLQAGGLSFRTVCITEGLLDPGNFTTRACAVPFAPNPDSNEEFCPANCFGCESHSSALQLLLSKSRNLDVEAPDAVSQLLGSCRYDPVLLTMVFRLLNTLRLASLG
ncbi:hypothetical protein GMRT_10328 [Giardia muris]|nr:hypothetical protein GMRT_10328 [Giardia muris]|eukprot:TNJ29903.1 hypothetical protein GMRT_10328 [Giardia muris]